MRLALLQLNFTICDLKGNSDRIIKAAERAFGQGADICITPELAVCGYPPRDLLFSQSFVAGCLEAVEEVAGGVADLGPVLVGTPFPGKGGVLHNGACLVMNGKPVRYFGKTLLPNYDVFDEQRYFGSFKEPEVFEFKGRTIGVSVCEDIWNDKDFWEVRRYGQDPVEVLVDKGAEIIVNLSASPFSLGKQKIRSAMLASLAAKYGLPVLFCNQVGGNDDLIFAGRSMAVDEKGALLASGREFKEDMVIVDLRNRGSNQVRTHDLSRESEAWNGLVLGLGDYVRKCGFREVVLGLSGGIDSALVAAAAARALGPQRVTGVLMPSPYSSRGSIDDSLELAGNLGIKTRTIPIHELMESYDRALAPCFAGLEKDVTEENIQARIRGNLLMALSNKLGALVLATGNKSELAVGYSTIYGDMAGGLAPISDVPKTLVYAIARWLNTGKRPVIPLQILTKPPSAELRPNQKDQDTLPDYEILDQILHFHIQNFFGVREIQARGFEPELVDRVLKMVSRAEFKRRQCPPGLKITDTAFGTGWRMPLAARCSFVTKK
ncbi:NAD+ synthase [Desulfonatronovibrio hydrogenovorans]|uniref:NAD+ synthase n=1 Tax=Desulfonatronovibrio hydrogenovorans TaxID=53245 RepID=UPI00048F73A8|nr:NAD+ synthase [Desulfonatronovibrio hydrogenovorans]